MVHGGCLPVGGWVRAVEAFPPAEARGAQPAGSGLLLNQLAPAAAEELFDEVGGIDAAPEVEILEDGLAHPSGGSSGLKDYSVIFVEADGAVAVAGEYPLHPSLRPGALGGSVFVFIAA